MEAFAESLSTLKFANRAKNIRNQAVVNEDLDQRTLLRKYERELKRLRAELQRRNRELVDKRHLLEVRCLWLGAMPSRKQRSITPVD
jgi:kinesin family protein 3/17